MENLLSYPVMHINISSHAHQYMKRDPIPSSKSFHIIHVESISLTLSPVEILSPYINIYSNTHNFSLFPHSSQIQNFSFILPLSPNSFQTVSHDSIFFYSIFQINFWRYLFTKYFANIFVPNFSFLISVRNQESKKS